MTLLLIDGYDWLPFGQSQEILARNWFADGWFGDVNTQGGGLSCSNDTRFKDRPNPGLMMGFLNMTFGKGVNRTLNGTHYEGEHVIGQAFLVGAETDGTHYFAIGNTLSTQQEQFFINLTPDGSVRCTLHTPTGNVLIGSPAGTFYAGSWAYLEVKFTIGEEAVFEVRLNTVVIISIPAIHIEAGTPFLLSDPGFDLISYSCSGGGGGFGHTFVWDDLYLLDTTGAVNNDYLGNIKVIYQNVIGEDSVQWAIGGTSPAATNWQSVLNNLLDQTKYVTTRTTNDRDLYNANPTVNAETIYGVQLKGAYRLDDAGQRFVQNTLQTSLGTNLFGADHAVDQTFRYYTDIFELNPDTGLGWTDTEVNALLIGPKDVTP